MTPLEIHEYRMKWMPGYEVCVHSDLRDSTVSWCEKNLKSHQWKHVKYTDHYEDTFFFELFCDADKFSSYLHQSKFVL